MEKELILEKLNQGITNLGSLASALHISKKDLIPMLEELIAQHDVFQDGKYRYGIIKKGTIDRKQNDYGFVCVENEDKDYYVPEEDMYNLYTGDQVEFYPYDASYRLLNARIIRVLERKNQFIIGRYEQRIKKGKIRAYIHSTNLKFKVTAVVKKDLPNIQNGMIVYAQISYVGTAIEASILEVLGHPDDPGMDITQIALEYGFSLDFPIEVAGEVHQIEDEVSKEELVGRKDFTNLSIFTIDGDDSKDFDDAISIERDKDGNYILGVYIADVSHYVKEGMALDEEALKRGTSVYLADRVIPMLPHKLSNGICSLNENVIRLVLACRMTISQVGKLMDYEICEGYICSKHRMTYHNVNEILKGNVELCNQYKDIVASIKDMHQLSLILRSIRQRKGALSFETKEYKFKLNEDSSPKEIIEIKRDEAEKIIEDFMLMTNETVAYNMSILHFPCIYRIHEEPDQENLFRALAQIQSMGLEVDVPKSTITPKAIQKILAQEYEDTLRPIVNNFMLRSMMKAKYSRECLGHYGLAMRYYCHFTSPIRRYPDLMVHRLLKKFFLHPNPLNKEENYSQTILAEIALRNSKSERNAIECERSVNDMLFAWYMQSHIFKHFQGQITSMTSFGIFVTLENGVEGLISTDTMHGFITYSEEQNLYIVGNTKYRLGQTVQVVVLRANKLTRRVDFMFENDYNKVGGQKDENRLFK